MVDTVTIVGGVIGILFVWFVFFGGRVGRADTRVYKVPRVRRGNEYLVHAGGFGRVTAVERIDEKQSVYHVVDNFGGKPYPMSYFDHDIITKISKQGFIFYWDRNSIMRMLRSTDINDRQAVGEAEYWQLRAETAEDRAMDDMMTMVGAILPQGGKGGGLNNGPGDGTL